MIPSQYPEMICFRIIRRKLFNASVLKTEIPLPDVARPRSDVQIVIIGAGLAGLSAASHLIKHGFTRTIVLEAKDRSGGRVNSKQFGDAFCELGAKWIPIDASRDSMYELLQHSRGLQKHMQPKNYALYVNTRGEKISKRIPDLVDCFFRKFCSGIELQEKYKNGNLHDLNNVQTYFQAESNRVLNSLFREDEKAIADDVFTSLFKEFGSLLGCCLEYVNIQHITKVKNINATAIYIPTGLNSLLKNVTENIQENQVQVGKPVSEIKWYGPMQHYPKSVGCLDGSMFQADHIICTLPLGVLKNFSRYIFKPMLPKEKLKAIKNIGFGSPVKIYFEYEKNINPWFMASVRPLWSAAERRKDLKWTKQVVEISKLPTSRRVIEVRVGGAFYNEIEKLPDTELASEVTTLLRNCMRNPTIPYPASVLRSNWSSCACYLGGRPYFATESSMRDVNMLAEPLGDSPPSLLFAGDATILNGFGTIDGARRSGIREANRIVEYYSRLSG